MKPLDALLVSALIVTLTACGPDEEETSRATSTARPVVYTTFYPTTYFARRIGGDLIDVVCPVPDDEDPIFWNPDDAVIEAYQKADLIVLNGARFEKWVLATSLPDARVVDTAKAFEKEFLTFQEAVEHSHGPGGKHAHEGVDGHTWLDPNLAKIQAATIAEALKRRLPDEAATTLAANLKALEADLDALNARFASLTDGYDGTAILASHPAYNYPAFRYGWKVRNLDLDPAEPPTDQQVAEVKKIVGETGARFLLWEGDPLPEIARRFAIEAGVTSIVFSPCELLGGADRAAGRDYLDVMQANLAWPRGGPGRQARPLPTPGRRARRLSADRPKKLPTTP